MVVRFKTPTISNESVTEIYGDIVKDFGEKLKGKTITRIAQDDYDDGIATFVVFYSDGTNVTVKREWIPEVKHSPLGDAQAMVEDDCYDTELLVRLEPTPGWVWDRILRNSKPVEQ